jgi:hypothetical protein
MEMEIITLSEISQSQRLVLHVLPYIEVKNLDIIESKGVGTRGLEA